MKRRYFHSLLLSTMVLLGTGCPPERGSQTVEARSASEGAEQEPVAVINGEVLTRGEFERRIKALTPAARARFSTEKGRRDFLDDQIQFEVLADVAERKGYGDRPEVRNLVKEAIVRQMLREEVSRRVQAEAISSEAIRAYYDEHRDEFERPAARHLAVITAEHEEVVRKLRDDLAALGPEVKEADRVLEFRKRAARYSLDPQLRRNGGDLGWLDDPSSRANTNTGRNKALAPPVFALEAPGEVTAPVEVDGIWYVATFLERRPSHTVPLESAAPEIREKLFDARRAEVRAELLAELRAGARVEIDEAVLDGIPAPDPATATPSSLFHHRPPVRDLRPGDETRPAASEAP